MDASIIPTHVTTADVVEPTSQSSENVTYTTGSETGTTEFTSDGIDPGNGIAVEVPTEPFSVVEIMPEYEGGEAALMKFILKKMHYPSKAQRRGDQGTVYVSFVVGVDGKVTDVKVLKGIGKECDEEAVRVISMLDKWKPGIQNKMAVPVRKVLPIKFKLDN
jgi:protein TonB